MTRFTRWIGAGGLALFFLGIALLPVAVQAATPGAELGVALRALAEEAEHGSSQAAYDEIHEGWEAVEDQVRDADPGLYVELEAALDGVKEAVAAAPADAAQVSAAFAHLHDELDEAATRLSAAAPATDAAVAATPADVLTELATVAEALEQGELGEAQEHLALAIRAWPSVEGAIAAKSQADYTAIEAALGRASAALSVTPADAGVAASAVAELRAALAPYAAGPAYTAFDAAAIILREGLEALLVVVALLAFLRRSGNEDKRGWIWAGAGLGVLASLLAALLLQSLFSQVAAGQNREIVEGVTGLAAAGLLFYVSYWLHSKASLSAWRRYIDVRTSQALARGSTAGLAALAFLAVFREGAETAVFYIGMAPSIERSALLTGLGVGILLLAIGGVLMLAGGAKLPLRPFFRVAGFLVYYLGFKFVGTGIHALQVAGVLPITPVPGLPAIAWLGIYPTWETLLPQLLLLAGAAGLLLYLRLKDRRVAAALDASPAA